MKVSGIDYPEASMRFDLGEADLRRGSLNVRLIGTHLIDYLTQSQTGGRIIQSNNNAGTSNNVKDRVNLQVGYRDGPLSIDGQLRYFRPRQAHAGPDGVLRRPDIKSVTYTDLTRAVSFLGGWRGIRALPDDQQPVQRHGADLPARRASQASAIRPTPQVYDVVGRYITTGIRAKF